MTIVHKTNTIKYKEIKVNAESSQATIPEFNNQLIMEDYNCKAKQIWDPKALPESEVITYLEKAYYFFDLYLGNQSDYNLMKLRKSMSQLRLHLEEVFLKVLSISCYDIIKSLLAIATG